MVIQKAKNSEYEAMLRFLEDAYGHSQNFFPLVYSQVWRKENTRFKNILMIKEKNEIASLVRIFPLLLHIGDTKLKVAGIGSVSTSFSHRGKGYMSILMKKAIEEMKKDGYSISILWGDRHRYSNFGYEVSGQVIEMSITQRGLEKIGIQKLETHRYLGEKEILRKIIATYNAHSFKKERKKKEFELLYKKIGVSVYYAISKKDFAYVVMSGERKGSDIVEYGGNPRMILGILKYLTERFAHISTLKMEFPDFSHIPPEIFKTVSYWNIKPVGMIKIVDLKKTIELYRNIIERSLADEDEFTLKIKGEKPVCIRKIKGKLQIKEEEGKNSVTLKEQEMVKLLFGTSFWTPSKISSSIFKLLRSIFPLNVFVWTLDHI